METVRIGVTGSGFMGRTHVDAAAKLKCTTPVAVTGGSRAQKLASDYEMDADENLAAMLKRDDIDAIVIATPHWLHCEQALAAAEAGKHVLVEKPMATTVEDCDRMIEAFSSKGLILRVGYHQRFRESNYRTRELIAGGAIGNVHCIQMSALFDITTMRSDGGFGGAWGWWTDPRAIAHLINSAPHNIDLCRWWMESDLATVSAQNGTFREENPNENTTMALLRFENGAMATYWSSSVLPEPGFSGESFRFRIMGERGVIDLDPYDQLILGADGKSEVVYRQPPVGHDSADSAFAMARMGAYCDQMQGFVDAIDGKCETKRHQTDSPILAGQPDDGRAGVAATLAMLHAGKHNQVVQLARA